MNEYHSALQASSGCRNQQTVLHCDEAMSQCASFFPPGAKWGLVSFSFLATWKPFVSWLCFSLSVERRFTPLFGTWCLYWHVFCLDQKNTMIPLSLCVCLYQWRPKLTSSVVPHHFSTFVFWSKFSHRAQNTPIPLLCWPASPEFSCLSLPSREITQVCWHTQILHGCWRLHSGPYIYAYIMHFTNLAVFPRYPPLSFLNVNNQGKNILYNKDKIKF